VVVVLTPDSVESEWVEKELIFASSLKRKIVPLFLRQCDLRLIHINLHYIDIQGAKYQQNFHLVLRALNVQPPPHVGQASSPTPADPIASSQAESLTYKITLSNGMEFMRVPAGPFLMGSRSENRLATRDERPQHSVDIPYDYWMERFPVTNELYRAYARARGIKHPVGGWEKKKDHPVVRVTWTDTIEYYKWLNNLLKNELPSGSVLRLPTEAEWEKAARGEQGNEWPWGDDFDKNKCNSSEGGKSSTTPVGLYSPVGDSPCGCADMVGNVWEWTYSLFKPYPYQANDGRENEKVSGQRVLRGGSFFYLHSIPMSARCACRFGYDFAHFYDDMGFRVVIAPPIDEIIKLSKQ
jgi:formylglycine-generating enzyme required for sulfatase activity